MLTTVHQNSLCTRCYVQPGLQYSGESSLSPKVRKPSHLVKPNQTSGTNLTPGIIRPLVYYYYHKYYYYFIIIVIIIFLISIIL